MILHAAIHWPDEVSLDLWPTAMEYAAYLYNIIPKENSGIAPIEPLYLSRSTHEELRTTRVW